MNGLYVKQAKCEECGLTREVVDLVIRTGPVGECFVCKDPAVCERFKPLVAAARKRGKKR